MGQYCKDYRRLFGETPSTTLARGQSLLARTMKQWPAKQQ